MGNSKKLQLLPVVTFLLLIILLYPLSSRAGILEGALGNPVDTTGAPLAFATDIDTPWTVDSVNLSGTPSARSGSINGGESSSLTATVTGPASISFFQMVSSEPAYDGLAFSIDGSTKCRISGEVDWQQKAFFIPAGTHTLRWKYAKNAAVTRGSDAAWLDHLVVSPSTVVAVTSPNGGENFIAGSPATISWKAPAAAEKYDLYYSTNNGTTWKPITSGYAASPSTTITYSSWSWLVGTANMPTCKVKVVAKNRAGAVVGTDMSDKPFAINSVRLLSPNGGDLLQGGGTSEISWVATASATAFALSYSRDNGRTWQEIATVSGTTSYSWTVPVPVGDKAACKVRVVARDAGGAVLGTDTSDAPFTMQVVRVTAPNGGESFSARDTPTIGFTVYGQQNAASAVISYTTDNGATWGAVTTLKGSFPAGSYTYSWSVPAVTTLKTGCRVKVVLKTAAGAVVGTDVSDAVFTIQPVFSLSGTVTAGGNPLPGVTVTLGGDGDGTVTTDTSGRYTFSRLLNGSYTVTPERSGYSFSPASLARTVFGGNVSGANFTGTVVTSGWKNSVRIGEERSILNSYHLYSLDVKLNDNNVGVAVWVEQYSKSSQVWANRFVGGTWGTPVKVSTGTYAVGPQVAVDAAGNAAVVWEEKGYDQNQIGFVNSTVMVSRYAAGSGTWLPPVRVSAAPGADSTFFAMIPRIALDSLGRPVVVWEQDDPVTPARSVWLTRYDGSAWSAPQLVSNGTRNCEEPHVAVDGMDNVFVVWTQDTYAYDPAQSAFYNSTCNIWGRRYRSADGVWAVPALIGDPNLATGDGTERPRVAVNAGGTAVVAWEQRATTASIVTARFDPTSGTWSAPVTVSTSDWVGWPTVGLDDAGNALLAWIYYYPTPQVGWVSRYDVAGGTWGTPRDFEADGGNVREVLVDMNGAGTATLAWVAGSVVKASRYASSTWSAPTQVLTDSGIALDTNGAGGALVVSAEEHFDPYTGFTYAPFAAYYQP